MAKNTSWANRAEQIPTLRRDNLFLPLFEDIFEPVFGDFMPLSGENQQPPPLEIEEKPETSQNQEIANV